MSTVIESCVEQNCNENPGVQILVDKTMLSCCANAKDNWRYSLAEAYATRQHEGSVWVIATDCRCLSAVRTTGENDESRLVPRCIFPSGRRPESVVFDGSRWTAPSSRRYGDPPTGRFPKVQDILPDLADTRETVNSIAIDARLLANIQRAICDDRQYIRLYFNGAEGTIAVVGDRGIGVVMPCEDKDNNADRAQYQSQRQEITEALNGVTHVRE